MSYTEEQYRRLKMKAEAYLKEGLNYPYLETIRQQSPLTSTEEKAHFLNMLPAYQRVTKELNLGDEALIEQTNPKEKPSFLFKSRDQKVVAAAIMLLEKICKSSLVSPLKIKAISKALNMLKSLPKKTQDINVSISLVGPRRWFGDHEIYHWWDVKIEDQFIRIASGGHFYRKSTGGDTFSCMDWNAEPGTNPNYNDYLGSLRIVDDAKPFEEEVETIELQSGIYQLTVEDPTLEGLEEEENDMDEDTNADVAVPWVLLPCDDADRRLAARIDNSEVGKHEAAFAYGAEICDFCKCDLGKRGLFVDGKVRNEIEWANMCAPCFEKNGDGIGWGVGQLYALQPNGDRRLVAGFEK
jgi:hypothetical protein